MFIIQKHIRNTNKRIVYITFHQHCLWHFISERPIILDVLSPKQRKFRWSLLKTRKLKENPETKGQPATLRIPGEILGYVHKEQFLI